MLHSLLCRCPSGQRDHQVVWRRVRRSLAVGFAAFAVAQSAPASEPPGVSDVLREIDDRSLEPLPSPDLLPTPGEPGIAEPGGPVVVVDDLVLRGNTAIETDVLRALLADALGEAFDLAGLEGLAARLTRFYREQGYPFAQAVLPAQDLSDGVVEFAIVEGRYGVIRAEGPEQLTRRVEPFLRALEPGGLIASAPLERATLLLDDQPGVDIVPVMQPGELPGTGDLLLRVSPQPRRWTAQLGVDNHGSRSSGRQRLDVLLGAGSLLRFGDQAQLRLLASEQDLRVAQLGYQQPLGGQGWRLDTSLAYTEYSLDLDGFSGEARTAGVVLSYPLVRSQRSNLIASLGITHKRLDDERLVLSERRTVTSAPFGLRFDHRDALAGGGISFGNVELSPGRSRTDLPEFFVSGDFVQLNARLGRLQALTGQYSASLSLDLLWSDVDPGSSEALGIAGPAAVRGYASGEASGPRAGVSQFELRRQLPGGQAFGFFDHGRVQRFEGSDARTLSAAGLGVRLQRGWLDVEAVTAWPLDSADAEVEPRDGPRSWLRVRARLR